MLTYTIGHLQEKARKMTTQKTNNGNTTIGEAVRAGPAVVLIGHDRVHHIGVTAYRFNPHEPGTTKPRFCRGWPVMWFDDKWRSIQSEGPTIIKNWSDEVTIID